MEVIEIIEKEMENRFPINRKKFKHNIKRNHICHMSSFVHDEKLIDYYKNHNNKSGGYIGKVKCITIWIDIDNDEIEKSVKSLQILVNSFETRFGISVKDYHVFFSGRKGFHVGIPSVFLGIEDEWDYDIPERVKEFVSVIDKTNRIENIDYKIYFTLGTIRTPYSINDKSGLFKCEISHLENIFSNSVDSESKAEWILEYAKDPELIFKKVSPVFNEKLAKIWDNCKPQVTEYKSKRLREKPDYEPEDTIFNIPEKGGRADAFFKMGIRLYSSSLNNKEVEALMLHLYDRIAAETNTGNRKEDFSFRDAKTIIKRARNTIRRGREDDSASPETLTSMTDEVFDILSISESFSTTIDWIDQDLRGGMKLGSLYHIIGRDGSLKSLLLQNMIIDACLKTDTLCIYENLEMSSSLFVSRLVKRFYPEIDIFKDIKEGRMNKREFAKMVDEVNYRLYDRFVVINKSGQDTESIKRSIFETEDKYGKKVSIVGIDSFNSLNIEKDENSTAVKNSQQLKEIAKSTNTIIIPLVHTTMTCPRHRRDVASFARGGQKMLDNADGYFQNSLIVDSDRTNFDSDNDNPDFIYHTDMVYVRFRNKRETGSVIDQVMKLDTNNLELFCLNTQPKDYEVNTKTQRSKKINTKREVNDFYERKRDFYERYDDED